MENYIIVTGGTGFVGSHLIESLLNQNKKVILLKRSFSNNENIIEFENNPNLSLINLDKIDLREVFEGYNVEGIFHLATFAQRAHDYSGVSQMIESNIKFPTNLLENAVDSKTKFFINTGSFSEFSFENSPIFEDTKKNPFNLYAATKMAFEDILKFYYDNYDLNALTLKLFTPYGPKDDIVKIIPYLIINSLNKDKITIKSPSKELDFIYVSDVINAYIKAMENVNKLNQYESFNIGTGIPTSISSILPLIENLTGKNQDVEFGNLESDKVWCSNKKANDILGWYPEINVKKGLELTTNYYKNKLF